MKQWKFLPGYVKIEISGVRPERTVNALIAEGITVHEIFRVARGKLVAYVRSRKLKDAAEIAGGCGSQITVTEERGFTLLLSMVKARLPLFITLVLGFFTLILLSGRVLFISIDGCDVLSEEQVIKTLEASGVKRGMLKHNLDFAGTREMLLKMDERVSFADIRCSGVVLTAVIREANAIVQDDDVNTPSSIFADKDCIILSLVAEDGFAEATKGQAVKRGTLLINGDITPEGAEESVLVRAKGRIIAEVSYRFSVIIEPIAEKLIRSGESVPMTKIDVGFFEVLSNVPYEEFEQEFDETRVLSPCGLPISVTAGRAYELEMRETELTRAEMKKKAEMLLDDKLKKGIPSGARLISKETEFIMQEDGTMLAVMRIQTIESIGYSKCINANG